MRTEEHMGILHVLGDTDLMLTDPAEDIRGRKVRDRVDEEIGKVEEILIDDLEKRVRLFRVGCGGLFGLGEKKVLIPVDAITRITDTEVYINRSRQHVTGLPHHDSDSLDQHYLESVYAYYGFYPYWAPGYVYPTYPAYPDL
jgi:sporulation protein YlmC with PRC-barrel domain